MKTLRGITQNLNSNMKEASPDLKEGEGIRTAVDIAIFNDSGQVLLGKRLAKAGLGTWGFPGGHLKTDEKIADCARREIMEELGDKVNIEFSNEVLSVRENSIPPHSVHHVTVIIKGRYLWGEIKVNEPEICEKWSWFDLDDLPAELFSGIRETLINYQQQRVRVVSNWS